MSSENRAIVQNCKLNNNTGIGIYTGGNSGSPFRSLYLESSVVANNWQTGLYCNSGEITVKNCTFYSNAKCSGSEIFASEDVNLEIRNSIIRKGGLSTAVLDIETPSIEVSYSNIESGFPGTGNIDKIPFFVGPEDGDFHLYPQSPCIDAGDPNDDFSNEPLPNGGRINMGAFGNSPEATPISSDPIPVITEYSPRKGCANGGTIMTLAGANFGNAPGMLLFGGVRATNIVSWADDFIACAVPAGAANGNVDIEIINQQGFNYIIPEGYSNLAPAAPVYVSGNVSGVWENSCNSTYILTGPLTILEGDSLVIEPGATILADNTSGGDIGIVVEGVLIATGTANAPIRFSAIPGQEMPGAWKGIRFKERDNIEEDGCGGEIFSSIQFCTIEYAENGITINDWGIRVENCQFKNNSKNGVFYQIYSIASYGILRNSQMNNNGEWGIFCQASITWRDTYLSPLIENNVIENNGLGGVNIEAVGNSSSGQLAAGAHADPAVKNNEIRNNSGFGIRCYSDGLQYGTPVFRRLAYAEPVFANNIVYGNSASFYAAADDDELSEAKPKIINCTFWNNGPEDIFAGDSTIVTIANSTFWDGLPSVISTQGAGVAVATYSNFDSPVPGEGNISENPLFFAPDNNDFRLLASSPCIDAGNNDGATDPTDYAGTPRISDGDGDGTATVDMGAYEYHLPQVTMQPPASQELCEGEAAVLSVVAEGDGLSYQWQQGGQDISGADAAELSFSNARLGDSGSYVCVITDELGGSVQTAAVQLTVNPLHEVALQVGASSTAVCQGEAVVFTATPTDAGANPQFGWLVNGQPAGEDSTTFTTTGLNDGDRVACVLTSQETCATNNPAMSNVVTLEVYPLPEVTLTLPDTIDSATGPVELTGGFPAGGIYDGPGVTEDSGVFIFDLVAAGGGFHSITYTYTDGNGCSATATAEALVGLDQPAAGIRLQVFPNPSAGLFRLRADQPAAGWVVSVFNLQGRKVWEEAWQGREQEVDLRGAPKGAYLLRVTDGKRGYVRRLVVQ